MNHSKVVGYDIGTEGGDESCVVFASKDDRGIITVHKILKNGEAKIWIEENIKND